MERTEPITLTNMCMIYDNNGNVLVENKIVGNQIGLIFPGGHVENHESIIDSMIREVKEETGLIVVTHNNGNTYKTILSELNNSGYKVYSEVLSTLDYGIPQNRQRIYFIGIRNDLFSDRLFEWPKPILSKTVDHFFHDEIPISDENMFYLSRYLNNSTNKGKYTINDLLKLENMIIDTRMNDLRIYKDKMPTLRSQRDGIYYVHHQQLYQLSGIEALLFQGFPYENIKILKNQVSDRHLLMQAGNAMSVNVIAAIGKSINQYNESINKNGGL